MIEVTSLIRVGIEEETLGAAFHYKISGCETEFTSFARPIDRNQNLKGFLRILPVFFRMDPTLFSSFFCSVEAFV